MPDAFLVTARAADAAVPAGPVGAAGAGEEEAWVAMVDMKAYVRRGQGRPCSCPGSGVNGTILEEQQRQQEGNSPDIVAEKLARRRVRCVQDSGKTEDRKRFPVSSPQGVQRRDSERARAVGSSGRKLGQLLGLCSRTGEASSGIYHTKYQAISRIKPDRTILFNNDAWNRVFGQIIQVSPREKNSFVDEQRGLATKQVDSCVKLAGLIVKKVQLSAAYWQMARKA